MAPIFKIEFAFMGERFKVKTNTKIKSNYIAT